MQLRLSSAFSHPLKPTPMHTLTVVLVTCLTSASVALLANGLLSNTVAPMPTDGTPAASAYNQDLLALRAELQALRTELTQVQMQPLRTSVSAAGLDAATIREMVAEALRTQQAEAVGNHNKPSGNASTTSELLAALAAASEEQVGDLWVEIEAQGRIDEVLAVYRDAVARNPQSIEARHELARATHAAAMAAPNHKNGRLWVESDDHYSKVLELDPQNWTARYEKAVKLAFWPDTYGRLPEAMGHFETLMAQQQNLPIKPDQTQVYIWLGNLHAQQGNLDQAKAVWLQGTTRHPENERLRARLATVGG